jgi:hypothetical protein
MNLLMDGDQIQPFSTTLDDFATSQSTWSTWLCSGVLGVRPVKLLEMIV